MMQRLKLLVKICNTSTVKAVKGLDNKQLRFLGVLNNSSLHQTRQEKYFVKRNFSVLEDDPLELDEDPQEREERLLRQKIIKASLIHVSKTGFNDTCLVMACHDLDLSSASSRLISNGPVEIAHALIENWLKTFNKKMANTDISEMNREEILAYGIKLR